mmetsp:Transcript_880/g.1900  ORF Transcript_880/g.1900 Transcript_880/m.1900 type:complete len:508 (-) Transcript_880:1149-2672(-)
MSSSEWSMGGSTLRVNLEQLHGKNRWRVWERMHAAGCTEGLVLMFGGESVTRDATDHEPVFRQESFFHWATGVREPDVAMTMELGGKRQNREGEARGEDDHRAPLTTLWIPRLPESYSIWMGPITTPEEVRRAYAVDAVRFRDEMEEEVIHGRQDPLHVLGGKNSDSGKNVMNGMPLTWKNKLTPGRLVSGLLFLVMSDLRVFKTDEEIEVMRYVSRISSDAHIHVMKSVRPGMMEYQLEALFRFFCYDQGGCRHVGYTCICASGGNGTVLHYGHAGAPNNRQLQEGDMCLLDMGGEYHCYGSDITCSYPANGRFSDQQALIYNAVLRARNAVIESLKPGVAWEEMHLLAESVILEDLRRHDYLNGSLDEMMESRLGAVFMPHGLGHLIGVDTHDVGGYLDNHEECPVRLSLPGLTSLRTRRRIAPRMCLTVEPGCYLSRREVYKAAEDASLERFLNLAQLEHMFSTTGDFGVRIEDVVLVLDQGVEILSHVPRTTKEIESVMVKDS